MAGRAADSALQSDRANSNETAPPRDIFRETGSSAVQIESFERRFQPEAVALDDLADALYVLLFEHQRLPSERNRAPVESTCFLSPQERGMC